LLHIYIVSLRGRYLLHIYIVSLRGRYLLHIYIVSQSERCITVEGQIKTDAK
jgi:hypothetical protein